MWRGARADSRCFVIYLENKVHCKVAKVGKMIHPKAACKSRHALCGAFVVRIDKLCLCDINVDFWFVPYRLWWEQKWLAEDWRIPSIGRKADRWIITRARCLNFLSKNSVLRILLASINDCYAEEKAYKLSDLGLFLISHYFRSASVTYCSLTVRLLLLLASSPIIYYFGWINCVTISYVGTLSA